MPPALASHLSPIAPSMAWKDLFRRVQPGEKPPEAPEALQTWTSQTLYGLLGGMLFGGYDGLRQARDATIPSPKPTNNANQRAAMFFVRGSILTGSRLGLFASLFSATALLVEHARDAQDVANYAAAGALTCGLFGASTAGLVALAPSAGFGAVAAAGVGYVRERLSTRVRDASPHEDPGVCVREVVEGMQMDLENHPMRKEHLTQALPTDEK